MFQWFTWMHLDQRGSRAVPIFAFAGSLTRPAPNYGDANGRGISTLGFDDTTGRLEPLLMTGGIDDASWLTVDAPRRRLHAICEVEGADQSAVTTFAIDPATGGLTRLGQQPTGGQTACHASLTPDARFLAVANYNAGVPPGAPDGAGRVFPIEADGTLSAAAASVMQRGSGPNPTRQERSHAHCAMPSPDGRYIYITDLGLDRIVVYALGAHVSLTHQTSSDFNTAPGIGPRHLVFSRDGLRLFMISELIPTVLSLAVDPETGAMTEQDRFDIASLDGGVVQPAGIIRTADDRFLFASLRQSEEILGRAVDAASGRLRQTGRWPSGGKTPRDLELSPSGRHLLVANQDSDNITVFAVDAATGTLSAPIQQLPVGTPMTIKFAVFPTT